MNAKHNPKTDRPFASACGQKLTPIPGGRKSGGKRGGGFWDVLG